MAVPRGVRFGAGYDQVFPQGAAVVGPVTPDMEYVSNEDKARGKQPKQRVDGVMGEKFKYLGWVFRTTAMRAPSNTASAPAKPARSSSSGAPASDESKAA